MIETQVQAASGQRFRALMGGSVATTDGGSEYCLQREWFSPVAVLRRHAGTAATAALLPFQAKAQRQPPSVSKSATGFAQRQQRVDLRPSTIRKLAFGLEGR
jgi:hypothetical protein